MTDLGQSPHPLPREDLSSAFAPVDRAAGLKTKLTRPSQPASSPQRSTASVPTKTETSVRQTRAAPEATIERRVQKPQRGPRVGVLVVYLPLSINGRLQLQRTASKRSATDVVLDCMESAHERLPEIVAAIRPSEVRGKLFTRSTPARAKEPKVQVSLRPTNDQRNVIDGLVADLQAPDRSAFVAAVLDDQLPNEPRKAK